MEQQDLIFITKPNDPIDIRRMLDLLFVRADWMSAAEVLIALGYPNTESHRRMIRRFAETATDELISGQAGYKHVAKATPEEIHHFASWMISQGKKMIARGLRTSRHAHTLIH